jgi:drug/metabolite transporter (DMT)-like permease
MSDELDQDRPRGRWPKLWAAWVVLALGSFLAIELPALFNHSGGDTLTEQVQYLGGFAPLALVGLVVGFALWLVDHFVGPTSRVWKWSHHRKHDRPPPP